MQGKASGTKSFNDPNLKCLSVQQAPTVHSEGLSPLSRLSLILFPYLLQLTYTHSLSHHNTKNQLKLLKVCCHRYPPNYWNVWVCVCAWIYPFCHGLIGVSEAGDTATWSANLICVCGSLRMAWWNWCN